MRTIRHAAALALIGWYLIMPPQISTTTNVDAHAPLGTWETWSSYDSAAECEAQLERLKAGAAKRAENHVRRSDPNLNFGQKLMDNQIIYGARCIASDDPRLTR